MSKKLGPIAFGTKDELVFLGREISEQRNYSDEIAYEIDKEVRLIIDNAYNRAVRLLAEHKDKLTEISELLIQKETLEGDEFEGMFDMKRPEPKPLFRVPDRSENGDRSSSEAAIRTNDQNAGNFRPGIAPA
jgi:cell division protease FtsH